MTPIGVSFDRVSLSEWSAVCFQLCSFSRNNIDYPFSRFLVVFVPLSILYKSNRNDLFVVVFVCSISFQQYQTRYGNNYLNLINSQAGQKKGEVLVSLYRVTSRDSARVYKTNCEIIHSLVTLGSTELLSQSTLG